MFSRRLINSCAIASFKRCSIRSVHVENRIKEFGALLPGQPAEPKGNYMQYSVVDLIGSRKMVYLSGHLPQRIDGSLLTGRIGEDLTLEQGQEASKLAALQILASLQKVCGGNLDNVIKVHRITGFVNSANTFVDQPKVLNGCSDFIGRMFGVEIGRHARSAVGVNVLPLNVAVEVEAIVEIDNTKTSK
jgi:enamine deaminase RidA (YjgF/YER057c/UK114 family)